MKRLAFLWLVTAILAIGCGNRKEVNTEELYGNSFIRLNVMEDFETPSSWECLELFDSAFHIRMPSYMKLSQTVPLQDGRQSLIYTYNDTTNSNDFHYGRIGIDYYKYPNTNFNKATDLLGYKDKEELLKPLVNAALKGGMKLTDKIIVQDGEILNGPFYDVHSFFTNANGKHTQYFGYDAYYRRSGHVKGGSPVSSHIFVLMNSTESAVITISHYDKDSLLFENMFKVIKTFKWNKCLYHFCCYR